MKKVLIIVLLFCFVLSLSLKVKATGATYIGEGLTISLSTSNSQGGSISLTEYGGNAENALGYYFTDDELGSFNCFYFTFFYNVTPRINAMNGNLYELGYSEASKFLRNGLYLNSGVYTQTDRQHADIIAYYDSDDNLVHTGNVIEVYDGVSNGVCGDSNLVKVISKWDVCQIVEHRGDCCIDVSNGNASYVLYYKYTNNHNCIYDFSIGSSSHTYCCTNLTNGLYCNFGWTSNHSIYYQKNDLSKHYKLCHLCPLSVQENHTWQSFNDLFFTCIYCNQFALYIEDYHDGIINDSRVEYGIIVCDGKEYLVKLIN